MLSVTTEPESAIGEIPWPAAPRTIEETGLSVDLLVQLATKMLHLRGEVSAGQLARRLGLLYSAIEPALSVIKQERLAEISGGGLTGGPEFVYRLTEAGRRQALQYLDQNGYVGVAPVPFSAYEKYMRAFAASAPRVATRERVREAFRDLVLSQRVLDQLGPAINGAHSLFVYGPPGNGKTVISQSIRNLLEGEIAIPHALVFDGQIIKVFDPAVHEPYPPPAVPDGLDIGEQEEDLRWSACRRPLVTVGGDLELSDLELSYSPSEKYYHAPLQLVANGGLLVIDDFGRQKCPSMALLNRWITPLESRVDYLTLRSGQKAPMPFVLMVVFATNLRPADIVDEAFLRRIHYKVFAESPTVAEFKEIFARCCAERQVEYAESVVDAMLRGYYAPRGIKMRASHPRDLIDHALALAEYRGEPRRLTPMLMRAACEGLFVEDTVPD
jgi:predicted ATPase with chaperone activity